MKNKLFGARVCQFSLSILFVERIGRKITGGIFDIYFSAKPPKGKEANWVLTESGKDFFLFFRLYGPEKAVWDKSWKLNDLEKI